MTKYGYADGCPACAYCARYDFIPCPDHSNAREREEFRRGIFWEPAPAAPRPAPGYQDRCGMCATARIEENVACPLHATPAEQEYVRAHSEAHGEDFRWSQRARWLLTETEPTLF